MKKSQILKQIQTHGVDASEALMLANESDILKWIESCKIDEDAHSWWDSAQEELRCMMAEFI